MNFVDKEYVARLQVGEDGSEIAGALDDRAGGRAEPHAELARHDLRKRCFAEAGGAVQEHVIERLGAGARRFNEDGKVFAAGLLAHEFAQGLRA